MSIVMKKCGRFGCDRGITHLRSALGYRTCGRHGSEASGEVSGTASATALLGLNRPRVVEHGGRSSHCQDAGQLPSSHAA